RPHEELPGTRRPAHAQGGQGGEAGRATVRVISPSPGGGRGAGGRGDRKAVPSVQRHRKYPVGIPVDPPPGWHRPPGGPPPLPRPPHSRFHAPLAFVGRALLVGCMVVVCMGVGWLLVQEPRKGRAPEENRVAKAPSPAPLKKAKQPENRERERPG